jgi:hypothetical protein
VEDTSEGPVAFAFLINGASHHRAVRGLDDLCRILCAPRPVPMSAAATTEARTADTSPTSSARSN